MGWASCRNNTTVQHGGIQFNRYFVNSCYGKAVCAWGLGMCRDVGQENCTRLSDVPLSSVFQGNYRQDFGRRGSASGKDFHSYWDGSEVRRCRGRGTVAREVLWDSWLHTQQLRRTGQGTRESFQDTWEWPGNLWSVVSRLGKQKAKFCGISNCLVYTELPIHTQQRLRGSKTYKWGKAKHISHRKMTAQERNTPFTPGPQVWNVRVRE